MEQSNLNSRIGKVGEIGDEYKSQTTQYKMEFLVEEDNKLDDATFNEMYVECLIEEDGSVWGAVKAHNFQRVTKNLLGRGYCDITVEEMIEDPEVIATYIIRASL